MSRKLTITCPSCGARIRKELERCPYCGAVHALASEANYIKGLNKEIKRIDNLSAERNKDLFNAIMHYVKLVAITMLTVAVIMLIIALVAKTVDHTNLLKMRESLLNGLY